MTEYQSLLVARSMICVVCVAAIWVAYRAVKNFGWQGLLVKCAVLVDALFFWFVVEFHHLVWTLLRSRYADGPLSTRRDIETFLYLLLCFYLLTSSRSLLWLMRPVLKWSLYVSAATWIVGFYAAAKGWI